MAREVNGKHCFQIKSMSSGYKCIIMQYCIIQLFSFHSFPSIHPPSIPNCPMQSCSGSGAYPRAMDARQGITQHEAPAHRMAPLFLVCKTVLLAPFCFVSSPVPQTEALMLVSKPIFLKSLLDFFLNLIPFLCYLSPISVPSKPFVILTVTMSGDSVHCLVWGHSHTTVSLFAVFTTSAGLLN